jgi:hypothetical protein
VSYTKSVLVSNIIEPIATIQQATLKDNDLSRIVDALNVVIEINNDLTTRDKHIGAIWNEITSDVVSSINAALSGFYRLGIASLRSILELGTNSIFYYDHKVEYYLYESEDFKADRYVTTLTKQFNFFTTRYVRSFNKKIDTLQSSEDSISNYLDKLYRELCDHVHGRYKTLTKAKSLKIEYIKKDFKGFESLLLKTIGILLTMYYVRFDIVLDESAIFLVKNTGVVKL